MGGKVEIRGLETIIGNMRAMTQAQIIQLEKAADLACGILYETVMRKVELSDEHDLSALSHYFSITANGKTEYIGAYSTKMGTDSGAHSDEFVHIQKGKLFSAVEQKVQRNGDKIIVSVGVDEAKCPYIKYLINGTSKMRPRDFLGHSWKEKKNACRAIIKNALITGTARGR